MADNLSLDEGAGPKKSETKEVSSNIHRQLVALGDPGGAALNAEATRAHGFKTVSATGTPEALVGSTTLVDSVILTGFKSYNTPNATVVYVGLVAVTNDVNGIPLYPGGTIELRAPVGKKIDLNHLWLDVTTNGDGAYYHSLD